MTEQKPFKVGDKVSWMGAKGVVERVNEAARISDEVGVKFDNNEHRTFCLDGRYLSWHKKPSLKHRKLKKSTKLRELWMNIYSHNVRALHSSKNMAQIEATSDALETAVRFVRAKKQ